jgi:hypothetical protein
MKGQEEGKPRRRSLCKTFDTPQYLRTGDVTKRRVQRQNVALRAKKWLRSCRPYGPLPVLHTQPMSQRIPAGKLEIVLRILLKHPKITRGLGSSSEAR